MSTGHWVLPWQNFIAPTFDTNFAAQNSLRDLAEQYFVYQNQKSSGLLSKAPAKQKANKNVISILFSFHENHSITVLAKPKFDYLYPTKKSHTMGVGGIVIGTILLCFILGLFIEIQERL